MHSGLTVTYACELFDHTKQAYYKKKSGDEEYVRRLTRIIDAIREIRGMDPGIGYYKLWLMLGRMFQDDWVPGRDAFLRIMREFGLTLPRPRPRHTTNSNHRYRKYKNLIKGFVPTGPNQLWVSDITYIDLVVGCCYLHLVTDAYSHKIVGWCLSDTLEAKYTMEALQMAMDQATEEQLSRLIHHSDRGVQYCCNAYTELLSQHGVRISMTEDYKPTDNAVAERVNGILKTEVIYRERRFKSIEDARERISQFIGGQYRKREPSEIKQKRVNRIQEKTHCPQGNLGNIITVTEKGHPTTRLKSFIIII